MSDPLADFRDWAGEHQAIEAYRFSYQPTFARSLNVALWLDSVDALQAAITLHAFRRGEPPLKAVIPLDEAAWRLLLGTLDRLDFWGDEAWGERSGRDGSFWRFWGLRDGTYKFREDWSPEDPSPARGLGWAFFNLVPPDFCPVMTWEQSKEWARNYHVPMSPDPPVVIVY